MLILISLIHTEWSRVQYLSNTDVDSIIQINWFLLFKTGITIPVPKVCTESLFYMYAYMYVSVCSAICSVQSLNSIQLCDSTDCSMPGFPVCHHLLEFAQTHVHWVDDAIWPLIPCCPLLLLPSIFPSIRVFPNESVPHIRWPKYGASASALILPMNTQDWFPLGLTGLISLLSKGLKSLLQYHNFKALFFSAQPSLWSSSHIHTWLLEKP